ncbi:MAG: hypothetical protein Fur0034_21490 [Desulfuromonadia bacterium]
MARRIDMTPLLPVIGRLPLDPSRYFFVGGVVRNLLRGEPPRDVDIVTDLPGELLSRAGFRRVVTTRGGVVHLFPHIAPGVVEATRIEGLEDLEGDLRRRDVTMNAMALSTDGRLIDPLGGEGDLRAKRLVPCSPESLRIDPGRVFRLFRFESHGYRMDDSCRSLLDPLPDLVPLPVERFTREMLRALEGDEPSRFFSLMVTHGAGRELLPELFRMTEIPAGPPDKHPEGDLFTHVCQVLERTATLSPDPRTRFCAIFHDIGKLLTPPSILPAHHHHEELGAAIAPRFCDRLRLPASYRTALVTVCRLHGRVNRWYELREGTKMRLVEEGVRRGCDEILYVIAQGDKPGRVPRNEWELLVRICRLTTRQLGIDPDRLSLILPADRHPYIHQKRLERWRECRGSP